MQSALELNVLPENAQPVTSTAFADSMVRFAPFSQKTIGIAVSGGPDSMALAVLAQEWAKANSLAIQAFIVDHALRDTSAKEAQTTQEQLNNRGIDAHVLRWKHDPVLSRLHITARKARYELLAEACKKSGISDLLLAHQMQDQAETILMRLAKGSGIDGLAGIAPENQIGALRLLRPLLGFTKEQLIATCTAANISYVTDPSNLSDKFARGRLRQVMPLLANEGMTLERLVDLGNRAAEARSALDHYAQIFLRDHAQQDDAGTYTIDRTAFRETPSAIATRVMSFILQTIAPQDYAPEYASLSDLINTIRNNSDETTRTLHGCLIHAVPTHIQIMREYAAITHSPTIRSGETVLWDNRWHVSLSSQSSHADQGFIIAPLGNPPHDVLDRLAPKRRTTIPQGRVRATMPALWHDQGQEKTLAHIPLLHTAESKNAPATAQLYRPV